ncbi:MAG TPA: substrate-binding domain-containing protein [Cytophagaceae bacterium]
MSNRVVKVAGVPEHFNLPWHLAKEQGQFERAGIDLQWTDYPGGTGAMANALNTGEADLAIVLTEGIIADIIKGGNSRIVQVYVRSPLVWGIHVSAHSTYQRIQDIKGKKYAISRLGSGSHLMAYVDAAQRGWKLSEDQMVIVNNLDGAVTALSEGKADVFMWEKFTTKPLVDSGIFRRIDECPTPWSCFVIAASNNFINAQPELLNQILKIIRASCEEFMHTREAKDLIIKRYGLKPEDAEAWYQQTKWATDEIVFERDIEEAVDTLFKLNLIPGRKKASELCDVNFCSLL